MTLSKIMFFFVFTISWQLRPSDEPPKAQKFKKQVQFKDEAENIPAVPQDLQKTPMAAVGKTQNACSTAPSSPLAALYTRTFGQGHTIKQAQEVIKRYLPITLKASITQDYVTPRDHDWESGEEIEDTTENKRMNLRFWTQDLDAAFGEVEEEAYVSQMNGFEKLYILPDQKNIKKVIWYDSCNQLITIGYTENYSTEEESHKETTFVWDFNPFLSFTRASIAPEQLMLVSLLDDAWKKNPISLSLSDCAVLSQEPRITTAELARVLLTFHPELQDHILGHLKGESEPTEDQAKKQKPIDYRHAYQAFVQAQNVVLAQADGKAVSANQHDAINQALEEYIIDERPHGKDQRYVQLFVKIRSADSYYRRAMITLADAIQMQDLKRVQDNLNYRTIGGSIKFITRMCCGEISWASISLLHEAIRCWNDAEPKSDAIFKAILNYEEILVPDSQAWKAYKYSFKDAVLYALTLKNYNCAMQIAQKMKLDPELHADAATLVKDQRPLIDVMAALSGSRK